MRLLAAEEIINPSTVHQKTKKIHKGLCKEVIFICCKVCEVITDICMAPSMSFRNSNTLFQAGKLFLAPAFGLELGPVKGRFRIGCDWCWLTAYS